MHLAILWVLIATRPHPRNPAVARLTAGPPVYYLFVSKSKCEHEAHAIEAAGWAIPKSAHCYQLDRVNRTEWVPDSRYFKE